ncbi:lipopolysaccharide biosynthesis protein [Paenibacillus methanolicus]|uniref:O-antigen/teichoic acid export membrane protein n=1 Tax=Paenibacillus methanolicus TaxID=582686 RepID=A0A5S5BSK8_9BACL|nr:oligosaccharide flippase family protein [Paenibacillus methanolicus]TYP69130.1 O-antigen/teichoic acid export membrane protein [Paenibacillus methanolicus]
MRVNQLKAGAALSYLSMAFGFIVFIVYTPFMLRYLGQSEYGLYNLVISVVSYLSLLSFGFGSAYIRFYSRFKAKEDSGNIAKLNGMFLLIFSAIGFISVVAGLCMVLNIGAVLGSQLQVSQISTAKILMSLMIVNIAFSFPSSVFHNYVMAHERYVFQKSLQLIKVVATPFITIPVLILGYKSVGVILITVVVAIVIDIANMLFCLRKLQMQFSFQRFDTGLLKELTVFSSYIFMNMIIDQINWNVDKFILGRFSGTVAVAIYGLASQFNTYYLQISTSISNVFIPRINKLVAAHNNNEELTNLFTRIGRIQFMLLALIFTGFLFFGQSFITLWAGAEYKESFIITLLLLGPVTIPLIQNIGIEIQRAKNMHQFRSWVYLAIAIVNICISIPLAKQYGGIGSALGTAISLFLGNGLIMNWYYHKRVGLNMIYFWKRIVAFFPSLVAPILFGILAYRFIDQYNFGLLAVFGSIYCGVFGASLWLFGMDRTEKELLLKPLRAVMGKLKATR